jgi:hypothetical protein
MPLIRKAGYGICRSSTSKSLLRLQDGWFILSHVSGAYCSKTVVSQVKNNSSDYSGMQSYCWNLFWGLGTGAWVSTGATTATPLYMIGRAKAITYAYPWLNECTQIHVSNRYQLPSFLTGLNITSAKLWLESPGETERDFLRTSGDVLYSDTWYANDPPSITGALNVRFSTALQAPRYAWDGADMSMSIDALSDNTGAVVGVEAWNPFSYAGNSRFAGGAWSSYDIPSGLVSWINANRDFFMQMNWTTGYAPWFYVDGYSNYTYTRNIRGIALQVFCEF